MDLQNHLLRRQRIHSLAIVLGTVLSIASANGMAADRAAGPATALSNATRADTGMRLKLDLALTLNGDECEDDIADGTLIPASGSSVVAPVAALASASRADTVLAKLSPGENIFASAKLGIKSDNSTESAPRSVPHAAEASKADKAVSSVAAAPAAPAVPDAPAAAPWFIVPADKTLNTALARWAAAAGWQLLWELPVDYAVDVRTEIRGSFVDAVGLVAKSMETAEIPMKAIFYEGNRVLRIVAKGSE
jgi:hypothetical protein